MTKPDERSIDTILVERIQKSVKPSLLKIVQDKTLKIADRKAAFSQMVFKDDDATGQLWEKYRLLIKKMKFKLIATARNNNMNMNQWIEDYEQTAFERFLWSVCVVRMKDCAHLDDTWSIYQHLWGNFMAMNRDLVKNFLNRVRKEEQIYGFNDAENNDTEVTNLDRAISRKNYGLDAGLVIDEEKKLFWDSWQLTENRMSSTQKKIAKHLQAGMKPKQIREKLDISSRCFNEELEGLKRTFSIVLGSLSKGRGDSIDYNDMVRRFQ